MRPPRLVLVLAAFVALPVFLTFFSLLYSHPRHRAATESSSSDKNTGLRALFSFHAPSSLFPPSAVISLTDDNSTFFLARPAAFGPFLPPDGLSAQLWVGNGFGDDNIRRGGASSKAEGELGCSDVPGWSEDQGQSSGDSENEKSGSTKGLGQRISKEDKLDANKGPSRQANSADISHLAQSSADVTPREDDGTDDFLHHPLPNTQVARSNKAGQTGTRDFGTEGLPSEHADIQSLQEGAEIAGKIVLLSRGGCGFLEKVKWAQRRGGVALIVGDNTRGAPLTTMYARGDTSNVSIPALFTSHTTAHLLSSLIPQRRTAGAAAAQLNRPHENLVSKVPARKKGRKIKQISGKHSAQHEDSKASSTSRVTHKSNSMKSEINSLSKEDNKRGGLLRSVASFFGLGSVRSTLSADSRRPPSSGRTNWVISDSWVDEPQAASQRKTKDRTSKDGDRHKPSDESTSQHDSKDDFVIGVQDWRDRDLVASSNPEDPSHNSSDGNTFTHDGSPSDSGDNGPSGGNALVGGSITPSSGEYEKPKDDGSSSKQRAKGDAVGPLAGDADRQESDGGWLSHLINSSQDKEETGDTDPRAQDMYRKKIAPHFVEEMDFEDDEDASNFNNHEGLWVTISPTTMSTSPFFDTLLVLVVSPLVTLTVVYALLLLRSRIRRRRWRAPKSVVDRLPVRTYHTMSCSSNSTPPQIPSPRTSSPTSPLLQSNPRAMLPRSRPRSQTASAIDESASASLDKAAAKASLAAGSNPLKRYTGRQVECVVCLEEYIDGQSRVMSLPCGHEFHADCM